MELPQVLLVISSGMFGLIIGSFLNVLVLRHNTGKSMGGRSGCFSCGAPLTTLDLVPVFSYLALGGKCRRCGSRIAVQYPLVEATTAVLFALIAGSSITIVQMLVGFVIIATAVALVAYDMKHTILPDVFLIIFGAAGALFYFLATSFSLDTAIAIGEGAIVTAAPLMFLWAISGGRWLGLGDVKLAAGIGALLGISGGITALWFAYVVGAVIAVSLIALPYGVAWLRSHMGIAQLSNTAQPLTMKSEIAFGPFLLLGCMIVWIPALYDIPIQLIAFLQ